MTQSTEIADGFKEVEPDFGLTFTWSNTAYPCTAGSASDLRDLGAGGFAVTQSLLLNIRRALFTGNLPETKQRGIYSQDGRSYSIEEVAIPPGSPFIQLTLVDPRKGV